MQNGAPAKIAAKWLQPGIVLGFAMRLMCFGVLQGTPGIVAPSIQDSRVNAMTMWDHVQEEAVRIENQVIEAYDNIRFAYQVAQRLRELEKEPAGTVLQANVRRANYGRYNAGAAIRIVKCASEPLAAQPAETGHARYGEHCPTGHARLRRVS